MTITTVRICPDVQQSDLRRLAANVCLKAVHELRDPDTLTALDAALWLTGEDFPVWAECANVPFADPIKLLTSGQAKQAKTKKRGQT